MAGLLLRLRLDPAPPLTPLRTPADSLTINSPIMAESGASFVIDSGVSLRLTNQPEHPLSTFFQGGGAGSVTLGGEGAAWVGWAGGAVGGWIVGHGEVGG